MACGFDKGLVAAFYDGETTEAERVDVERHLASCPECARDLASMKELSAAMKPLGRAAAPMSIAEGVIREIGAAPKASRRWIGWSVSAAAVLLVWAGTFYYVDNQVLKSPGQAVAKSPALSPGVPRASAKKPPAEQPGKDESKAFRETDKEVERKSDDLARGARPAAETPAPSPQGPAEAPAAPPAPPPPPAFEKESADAVVRKEEKLEGRAGGKDTKPAVPVVRVTAPDAAEARLVVELFLKERELKAEPGSVLLGRSAFVRDHYLQLELTEDEMKLLEKRLAEIKGTTLVRSTLDVEKKRVAEETAKNKAAGQTLGAPTLSDRDEKAPETVLPEDKKDRGRGLAAPAAPAAPAKALLRKSVIFVFEPIPPAK